MVGVDQGEQDVVEKVALRSRIVEDAHNTHSIKIMAHKDLSDIIQYEDSFVDIELDNINCIEDGRPVLSFDNLNVDVDFLTDDDDDEL